MLLPNLHHPFSHLEKVNAWIQYEQIMICKKNIHLVGE